MHLKLPAAVATALALLAGAAPAGAAQTVTVTTTADDPGGICPALPQQPCSLRAAVMRNQLDGGGDTVLLPAGRYVLTSALPVTRAIAIRGTGRTDTIIDANRTGAALTINLENETDQTASLQHLSVTGASAETAIIASDVDPLVLDDVDVHGNETDGFGGGLTLAAGASVKISNSLFASNTANGGGAIAVLPTSHRQSLEITDSELRNNVAGPGGGGGLLAGFSDVTIERSRLDGNTGQLGGAIATMTTNGLDPAITLRNSTLDGNVANPFDGGAIALPTAHAGALNAESDTFVANTAPGGADFAGTPSAALLHNTVLGAGSTAACADGLVVSSLGHNVAADTSCQLAAEGDRQGVDPHLGAVADNGGPTLTALPGPDSPLLDAADPVGCARVDERSVLRPQGAGCDIGAVERAVAAPSASTGPAQGAIATGSVDPGGQPTEVRIDYGPTQAYGQSVRLAPVSGWLPVAVNATLPVPSSGATLHYRVAAHNQSGDAVGEDRTIITQIGPPPPGRPAITRLHVRIDSRRHRGTIGWRASAATRLRFAVGTRLGRTVIGFRSRSRSGVNRIAFPPRVLRRLRPGRYWLTVAGTAGGPQLARARFRVPPR